MPKGEDRIVFINDLVGVRTLAIEPAAKKDGFEIRSDILPPLQRKGFLEITLRSGKHDPKAPPAGLPGQLPLRRPDIRGAELTLEADNLQVASARAAIFPQLTLGGSSAGIGATIVNDAAFGPQGLLTLVPALAQTLSDGGFKRSTVNVGKAQRAQDLYVYLQTIQTAMQGVTDGLSDYARFREEVAEQTRLTQSARDYARLADLRYRGGVGNYIDVLDSESRLFAAELPVAQLQLQQRLAETNLYAALGGGWQDAPAAASASPGPGK